MTGEAGDSGRFGKGGIVMDCNGFGRDVAVVCSRFGIENIVAFGRLGREEGGDCDRCGRLKIQSEGTGILASEKRI